MDHEDLYTHLIKFYETAGSLGIDETGEEALFKRMFPHSLV
jgi:hypothetical protein